MTNYERAKKITDSWDISVGWTTEDVRNQIASALQEVFKEAIGKAAQIVESWHDKDSSILKSIAEEIRAIKP